MNFSEIWRRMVNSRRASVEAYEENKERYESISNEVFTSQSQLTQLNLTDRSYIYTYSSSYSVSDTEQPAEEKAVICFSEDVINNTRNISI